VNEADFQGWVTDVATLHKWRWWHVGAPMRAVGGGKFVPDSRAAGLPDLVLLHDDPPRLIFAELKGDSGHPVSDEQREFLRLASVVGQAALEDEGGVGPRYVAGYVWTPADRDAIERILKSKVLG